MAVLGGVHLSSTFESAGIVTGTQRAAKAMNDLASASDNANKRIANSTNQVAAASRVLRSQFQQVGFQVQDIVVQWQAGTRAATIFAQQGAQLASVFGGPYGAAIGVAIAITGALATALLGLRGTSEAAAAAQKVLDDSLVSTSDTVESLTKKFLSLNEAQRQNAFLQLAKDAREFSAKLEEQDKLVLGLANDLEAITRVRVKIAGIGELFGTVTPEQRHEVDLLIEDIRNGIITTREMAAELDKLAKATGNEEIRALADQFLGSAVEVENLKAKLNLANQALKIFGDTSGETADQLARFGDLLKTASVAGDEFAERQLQAFRSTQQQAKRAEAAAKEQAQAAKTAASEAARLAAARKAGLADLATEVDQLARLNEAYAKDAKAVRDIEVAIEAENIARRLGIEAGSEQAKQILEETDLRRELKDSIDAQSQAMERQRNLLERSKMVGGDEGAERQLAALRSTQRQEAAVKKQAEDAARVTEDAFGNMLESIQSEFTDTFAEMVRGGIRSFEDIADAATDIFANLSANIASLAIFDPTRFKQLAAQSGVSPGVLGAGAFAPPLIGAGLGLFGANAAAENFAMGSGLGAGVGALAGSVIPGVGTALGAIVGGLAGGGLGSIFGGLFGGGASGSQVSLSGGFGRAGAGGTNEASAFIRQLDTTILELLDERQTKIADEMLRASGGVSVQFGDEGPSANDLSRLAASRIGPAATGLGFNAAAIAGGGRTPEQQLALLNEAIQLERAIEDLTGAVTPFRRSILDLRAEFAEAEAKAKEFGISTKGMGKALAEAEEQLITQRRLERQELKLTLAQFEGGGPASGLKVALLQIEIQFDALRQSAEALGISTKKVNSAQRAAERQLIDARRLERQELKLTLAQFTSGGSPAAALKVALLQIEIQFEALRQAAIELGLSLDLVDEAFKAAKKEARQASRDAERQQKLDKQLLNAELNAMIAAGKGASDLTLQLLQIDIQFEGIKQRAKEAGISLDKVNKAETAQKNLAKRAAAEAEREEARQRQKAKEAAISTIRDLSTTSDFVRELDRISDQFAEARDLAREFGLSIDGLNQAQAEAVRALQDRQQAEIDALALSVVDPFERILSELGAFSRDLDLSFLNPVELFKRAQADFEAIAKRAKAGDLEAIQQLDEAGRFFIEQAARVGASPGMVDATREVMDVVDQVKSDVSAAQKDAAQGIEGAVARASRAEVDTLLELINTTREVVHEVQKLQSELRQSRKA